MWSTFKNTVELLVVSYRHGTCLQIQIRHHHNRKKNLPVKSVSKGELSSGNSGSPVMLMKAITTLTDVASRPPPSLASTVTCVGGGGKIEPLEILKPDFWISGHARHPDVTPNFSARRTRSRKLSE